MPEPVDQLIAVAASGVFLLFGVWVGKAWERRSAAENWRRDRRSEAYSRLLAAISATRDAAIRMWSRETDEARIHELNKMIEAEAPTYHLVAHISLLGPDDVARAAHLAANKLTDATGDLIERAPTKEPDEPLGNPKIDAAQAAHDVFLEAARRALM